MASTEVNGNYAPQGYENSYSTGASNFTPSQQPAAQPAQPAPASEVPKDEVGWYFVEQYYTTLSKSPERLYLFYNKRSQYVSGVEEEKVNVCLGQKAINERIKALDFKDTKVRVTNVDSQGSDANIVIQVIGEISSQGQPHKRFCQTFVLAEQTNGYFVLNDIFRYLTEEPEEEEDVQEANATDGLEEPAPTAAVPQDETEQATTSADDLSKVDDKLAEVAQQESTNDEVAAAAPAQQVPEEVEQPKVEEAPAAVEEASKETEVPAKEKAPEPEKPAAPAQTPTASAQKAAPVAMPSGPPKPTVPKTWASLAASAHKVATPVVAAPAAQQAPSQPKAAVATQPAADKPAQQAASARDQSPSASQGEATGWQTATGHKKEQSRAQNQGPAADPDQKRAYIKNVYSQVEEATLKATLSKFGEVEYLDVSRPKNCAFVDFKTPAGFQAAVAANPHTVNGVEIKVEERRQNPGSFRGGFPRGGAPRGGRGGVGGQAPRGGFNNRGRGGPSRGRGGAGAPQDS